MFGKDIRTLVKLVNNLIGNIGRYGEFSTDEIVEHKWDREMGRERSRRTWLILAMRVTTIGLFSYTMYRYATAQLIIIYNDDPALENLKQALHSKMQQLTSAYDQVSEQRPYYKANKTFDGVTIAIRTDAKEFTQDFRTGHRQIEVVVSRSFFQNCPNKLLADKFIHQLEMKLMQAPIEKNRSYRDMPVIRIF